MKAGDPPPCGGGAKFNDEEDPQPSLWLLITLVPLSRLRSLPLVCCVVPVPVVAVVAGLPLLAAANAPQAPPAPLPEPRPPAARPASATRSTWCCSWRSAAAVVLCRRTPLAVPLLLRLDSFPCVPWLSEELASSPSVTGCRVLRRADQRVIRMAWWAGQELCGA